MDLTFSIEQLVLCAIAFAIICSMLGAMVALSDMRNRIHDKSVAEEADCVDGVFYYYVRADYYVRLKISHVRENPHVALSVLRDE